MATKLFESSSGYSTTGVYEEDGEIVCVEEMSPAKLRQTVGHIQAQKDASVTKMRSSGLGIVGAQVPLTLHVKWKREWREGPKRWGTPWQAFYKAKLNDPAYKHLKVVEL